MTSKKRSTNCAVIGCNSSEYQLELWRNEECEVHKPTQHRFCRCKEPFKLFTFPSQRKRAEMRSKWKTMVARLSPTRPGQLWTVGAKQRVCSLHFPDGEPSSEHPLPSVNMGYHSSPRTKKLLSKSSRRVLSYTPSTASSTPRNLSTELNLSSISCDQQTSSLDMLPVHGSPQQSSSDMLSPDILSPVSVSPQLPEMLSPNLLSPIDASRFITVSVPPGRKGAAQMMPAEIVKTKKIANMRILVEQVIRRLKLFRILSSEMVLPLLKCFDDIIVVCGALSNLRNPIFVD